MSWQLATTERRCPMMQSPPPKTDVSVAAAGAHRSTEEAQEQPVRKAPRPGWQQAASEGYDSKAGAALPPVEFCASQKASHSAGLFSHLRTSRHHPDYHSEALDLDHYCERPLAAGANCICSTAAQHRARQ